MAFLSNQSTPTPYHITTNTVYTSHTPSSSALTHHHHHVIIMPHYTPLYHTYSYRYLSNAVTNALSVLSTTVPNETHHTNCFHLSNLIIHTAAPQSTSHPFVLPTATATCLSRHVFVQVNSYDSPHDVACQMF